MPSPYKSVPGDQTRNADGAEIHTVTAATATVGGGQAALATVAGYIIIEVAGVPKKVPYFNV
jgi:hypothetical protein